MSKKEKIKQIKAYFKSVDPIEFAEEMEAEYGDLILKSNKSKKPKNENEKPKRKTN